MYEQPLPTQSQYDEYAATSPQHTASGVLQQQQLTMARQQRQSAQPADDDDEVCTCAASRWTTSTKRAFRQSGGGSGNADRGNGGAIAKEVLNVKERGSGHHR